MAWSTVGTTCNPWQDRGKLRLCVIRGSPRPEPQCRVANADRGQWCADPATHSRSERTRREMYSIAGPDQAGIIGQDIPSAGSATDRVVLPPPDGAVRMQPPIASREQPAMQDPAVAAMIPSAAAATAAERGPMRGRDRAEDEQGVMDRCGGTSGGRSRPAPTANPVGAAFRQ